MVGCCRAHIVENQIPMCTLCTDRRFLTTCLADMVIIILFKISRERRDVTLLILRNDR